MANNTAAPTPESPVHEEEGDAVPCGFIIHVKTIHTCRRHTLLFPPRCPVVMGLTEIMDHSINQAVCGLRVRRDCGTMPHVLRSGKSGRPQTLVV